ncbi:MULTISPECIES: endonuclease MutS2 [unclassified Granulicatella]|uniref:endonuclease MutS2 n=1 Tax=unclassified Granulicatella TaxID=2630493 RepID=UPI001073A480|nr:MULTISPECIES: endonuclease MutS2 [unclassified Granulicatella]MBF0780729.1 endonuclease MutS2 [Granulicatella sp. 19428wC4_WM01]TFU94188.1 endonuclease MutS2 [Granulicatella sp. WM01]
MQNKMRTKLEFDKVLAILAQFTSGQLGKQRAYQLVPYVHVDEIKQALLETEDAVQLLRLKGGIPNPRLKDVSAHLKRLDMGAALNGQEISDIGRVLSSTRDVNYFFKQVFQEEIELHYIHKLAEQLKVLPQLTQHIQEAIAYDGSVLDDASMMLKHIRQNIKRGEQAVREKLDSLIRRKQSQLTETLVTIRNERYVLPVKQEYRNSFGGLVHDQSATGQTVFIEPEEVVMLNNRLRTLQNEEKQEIERILWELSNLLRPYTEDIALNNTLLGELDFINAKALYAKSIKASLPEVSGCNELALYGARHPLIDAKVVVKNDILMGGEYQCIVITGPNTGGKTILLKTLGLLQLMGQAGLHLPLDEGSQIGVFTQIFADIGDEQSIEQNLSTFSSHMTNIIAILDKIDEHSLVLFDELGSGTDPQEGASLAIAILDSVATKGSYVVATTHYPELKIYGYNRLGTINASMEFDSDTLVPTYKFLLGIPGRSNAFDISKRLGLPDNIIMQAREFIHEDSQQLNDMISDLERTRQQIEKEKEQVQRDMLQAEILLAEVNAAKQLFDDQRDEIERQAKQKANQIIEQTQEEAEKILSEIRQMQLKQGRSTIKEHELIEKKTALAQLKHEESLKKNKVLQKAKRNKALKVGDSVEVMSYGQRGVIEQKHNDHEFVVKMGLLKMKVALDDLRLIDEDNPKQKKYIPTLKGGRAKSVTSQLDLRGQRYEDAIIELDRYLDSAILAGYPQVTIVHGRGTGAIRDGVIKQLRKHRGVNSFEFAPINQGGNGATIVKFKG